MIGDRIRAWWRKLLREHQHPPEVGLAVGIGLFIGCLPLYGLHLPICIGLAALFKLNKVTLYAAANISNPLLAPVLVVLGLGLGQLVRTGTWALPPMDEGRAFLDQVALWSGQVPDLFLSCLLGSALLGVLVGVPGGLLAWWTARRLAARKVREETGG